MSNTIMLFIGIGIGAYIMKQRCKNQEVMKDLKAALAATQA